MAIHPSSPYLHIPKTGRWKESVSFCAPAEIDPHLSSDFKLNPADRIASAGSCFAQRIAEALRDPNNGYDYMITEEGPSFLSPSVRHEMGYGIYTARTGNVYTSLQLLQLFDRAFGRFDPVEPLWQDASGKFIDPFRPSAQPGGFYSEQECFADRKNHLAAVKTMFEKLDVFIFTLGLTECWLSLEDGAAFPICPGSGLGGEYDPLRHGYRNLGVNDVVEHIESFIGSLVAVNPSAQIILTVSPVPLAATIEPRHVLQSTTYSKSVLRVACEEIIRRHSHVHYFASYEIVMATGDSQSYFEADHRSVTKQAVSHVLDCFRRQYMTDSSVPNVEQPTAKQAEFNYSVPLCDEEKLLIALSESVVR